MLASLVLMAAAATPTIVGGTLAPAADSVVWVYDLDSGGSCSGVLVAPRWVLTHAACAEFDDPVVIIGDEIDTNSQSLDLYDVVDARIPPEYVAGFREGVGLLRLSRNAAVAPSAVDLGPRSAADVGTRPMAYGYGQTSPGTPQGAVLQRRGATFIIDSVDPAFLATEGASPNLCFGDLGGPLVARGAVIALNFATDLNCSAYSAFVRLDPDAAFIRSVTPTCQPGTECTNLLRDGFE